jgi:excisionase family DNA binding protein
MTRSRTKTGQAPVTADPKRPFGERVGKLVTPAEAADYLGVTERQVWRLLGRRELPKVKVGGLVRIHIDDLEIYVDVRRQVGA